MTRVVNVFLCLNVVSFDLACVQKRAQVSAEAHVDLSLSRLHHFTLTEPGMCDLIPDGVNGLSRIGARRPVRDRMCFNFRPAAHAGDRARFRGFGRRIAIEMSVVAEVTGDALDAAIRMQRDDLMPAFFLAAATISIHVVAETNPFQHLALDSPL
jgi:hypothetical protein